MALPLSTQDLDPVNFGFGANCLNKLKLNIPPKNKAELAENLTRLRENLGASQAELSRVFGISQSAYANWESPTIDKAPPTLSVLVLASMYEITMDAFTIKDDNVAGKLVDQLKAVAKIKIDSADPSKIKGLFEAVTSVERLNKELVTCNKKLTQNHDEIDVLRSDLSRSVENLSREIKNIKRELSEYKSKVSTYSSLVPVTSLSQDSINFQSLEGLLETFAQSNGYQIVQLNNFLSGSADGGADETSYAIYDSRITDPHQLVDAFALILDPFDDKHKVREIKCLNGGYYACTFGAGERVSQDLNSGVLTILGKLISVVKMY